MHIKVAIRLLVFFYLIYIHFAYSIALEGEETSDCMPTGDNQNYCKSPGGEESNNIAENITGKVIGLNSIHLFDFLNQFP